MYIYNKISNKIGIKNLMKYIYGNPKHMIFIINLLKIS